MQQQRQSVLIALFLLFSAFSAFPQVAVTVTNPANTTPALAASYTSLANAITALNGIIAISGPVTLTTATGSETAPVGGYEIKFPAFTSAVNTVTIKGSGSGVTTITAFTPQTSGNLNDALFKIIGCDYVIIRDFTMRENPANATATIATNNMTEWGVALLYSTTTNGAQYCKLLNNTISLNRTYANTFGIYSNSTHSAAAPLVNASATSTQGGNTGLVIQSNTISNINHGILVVGPSNAADHNTGVDIGGTGSATGNTISNFGTTSIFSLYANVSASVNGIVARNCTGINIAYNSVTSSSGGATVGTLRGIYLQQFATAPTGTFTQTIKNNTIALTQGSTTAYSGIVVETGTGNSTSALDLNNNNFTALTAAVATSAAVTGISVSIANLTTNINSNTFTNLSTNTTGNFTFISHSFNIPFGGVKNVNSNQIVTGFTKSGAGGAVVFSQTNASSPNGCNVNYQNNSIFGINVSGATTVTGISDSDGLSGAPVKFLTGNTCSSWSGGSGALTGYALSDFSGASAMTENNVYSMNNGGAITGFLLTSGADLADPLTISNNTVSNLTNTGATGDIIGINANLSPPNLLISGNVCHTYNNAGASAMIGIYSTNSTAANIVKNKIFGYIGTHASASVYGIYLGGGAAYAIANNLIGNLYTPNGSALDNIQGIFAGGTGAYQVYYNSVFLDATSTAAQFGNTCVAFSGAASSLDLRNNILVNRSVPGSNASNAAANGIVACLRRTSGTNGVVPGNYSISSNKNCFWPIRRRVPTITSLMLKAPLPLPMPKIPWPTLRLFYSTGTKRPSNPMLPFKAPQAAMPIF